MTTFSITKDEASGLPFLDLVCAESDKNGLELGFVPNSRFRQALAVGRLWIAFLDGTYCGHLMFGGVLPTLKIAQLYILAEYRGRGLAKQFIDNLVVFAEAEDYSSIRARVASDLEANRFWERVHFELRRTEPGGTTTGRIINIRIRKIHPKGPQTHMFNMFDSAENIRVPPARNVPINRSHWYTLDINVWLDLALKREPFYEAARKIVMLASRGHFRLRFTKEALEEARRNPQETDRDPLFEIASAWQTITPVDDAKVNELVEELRAIVFPNRSTVGRRAANDMSDLRHLALSILQQASGFVTRERALLVQRSRIWRRYGLEIISPNDLLDEDNRADGSDASLDGDLRIVQAGVQQAEVQTTVGRSIEDGANLRLFDPEDEGWACLVSAKVVAVSYWRPAVRGDIEVFLVLSKDLDPRMAQRAFDILNGLLCARARSRSPLHRIVLRVDPVTSEIFEDDLAKAGFSSTTSPDTYTKFTSGSPLDLGDWSKAKEIVDRETGVRNDWLGTSEPEAILRVEWDGGSRVVNRFEFETRFGLTALTLGKRRALYIPIREQYAEQLLPFARRPPLFTEHEAAFRTERVYFRSPTSTKLAIMEDLLFFYVSDPICGIVGVARCTSSLVLSDTEAHERFRRLAVLNPTEVGATVHCISFDNYIPFKRVVDLNWMKVRGFAPPANFVTLSRIEDDLTYMKILVEGLS